MKTYGVYATANFFIKKALENNVELSPMKLIKFAYIAQGSALAAYKKCLFRETIEAWKYGSVVPDLYHNLKKYGDNTVRVPFAYVDDNFDYQEY